MPRAELVLAARAPRGDFPGPPSGRIALHERPQVAAIGNDRLIATGFRGVAEVIAELLEAAGRQIESDCLAARAAIDRAALLIRVELDRSGDPGAACGLAGWQVRRVKAFVDANLGQAIRIRDLSEVTRRSPTHFCRAFKLTFDISPHAYVVRRRLDHAVRLMLATDAPLCEIALACGFSDQAHLSKLFRQRAGQSPAAWRRERRATGRSVDDAGHSYPSEGPVHLIEHPYDLLGSPSRPPPPADRDDRSLFD